MLVPLAWKSSNRYLTSSKYILSKAYSETISEQVNVYFLIHSMSFLMAPFCIPHPFPLGMSSSPPPPSLLLLLLILMDSLSIRTVKNFKRRNNLATLQSTWFCVVDWKMKIIWFEEGEDGRCLFQHSENWNPYIPNAFKWVHLVATHCYSRM